MIRTKLDTYRRKKREEKMLESVKNSMKSVLLWFRSSEPKQDVLMEESLSCHEVSESINEKTHMLSDVINSESDNTDNNEDNTKISFIVKILYLLYFSLWLILYIIALEFEFGAVYFIISLLFLICINTNTKPKKTGELSAYSVFNPNCEAIEGTLDASQFEKEIRYGVPSLH